MGLLNVTFIKNLNNQQIMINYTMNNYLHNQISLTVYCQR